ncbi:helix-turn-helix transcriptional regulator [Xenorhabdus sp. SGI246]|uniref:helix-turn-helix transcriptional regulator n=1 Tax=Xenorhabdus sp. SGI246 TaxID=3158263 RepID=UPI00349F0BB8
MQTNKVKQYRTQLSMTQKKLAELAHTSQQQIQRIETGKIAANITTAQAICSALGKTLDAVFPGAGQSVTAFRKKIEKTGYYSDKDLSAIAAKGIEMDPCSWTVKLYLRGHQDFLLFSMNSSDKRRMFYSLQEYEDSDTAKFFVFDSDTHRIALNVREVVFHQFLFDGPGNIYLGDKSKEQNDSNVIITLTDGGAIVDLSVEPDEPEGNDDDDIGQLSYIFSMLELEPEPTQRFLIRDMDGEDAFIRVDSIAILQVELDLIENNEEEI